jgi:polyisoprenyl-teichoic acid--peptidoglycan teichoic acid transferase
MSVASLIWSRPVAVVGLSTLLAGALALSGCSSAPTVAKKPVAARTTAVATPQPQPFRASGMPAELAAIIKPLYLGGRVESSPPAANSLSKRKPVTVVSQPVVVSGAVSDWKGVPVAVVTVDKDVTLAVKAPTWKVVGGWWPSLGVSEPSLGRSPRRVLLIGSDARPGERVDGARADSLHIVGVDGRGGGGVLGIARDAYVPLATGGQGKINSALTFGGPEAQRRTVASATGVPLEGYLITGFDGFQALVDGLGGLPLNVPVAVRDSFSGANLRAGEIKLNGGQALAYGRARHGVAGGDFGRSANQGRMIMAAAGLAKVVGPAKLPGILAKAAPRIETNMSAEQVLTFAAAALGANPKKVNNRVAIGGFGWTSDGQSIVRLDAAARRMFADIRDGNLS